jgi:hypothetical protein
MYARPEDHKFENLSFGTMRDKCLYNHLTPLKHVRFGPVMHKVTNDEVFYYNFHVKEHFSYKLGFSGRHSLCPGFATLKEKPANFKRIIKGVEISA